MVSGSSLSLSIIISSIFEYSVRFKMPSTHDLRSAQRFLVGTMRLTSGSGGEIIGLLNNDVEVISPSWLREMVGHALRPEVGAVGCRLLYKDGRIQHAGIVLGVNGVVDHVHKYRQKEDNGYADRLQLTQNFSAVTGACMLMRRDVFKEVGGLDEKDLRVAFNDIDLCLRIREAGYLIVWTPYAELYHLESASRGGEDTPEKSVRFLKEIDCMKTRWGEKLLRDPYYNPNLALEGRAFELASQSRAARPWLRDRGLA